MLSNSNGLWSHERCHARFSDTHLGADAELTVDERFDLKSPINSVYGYFSFSKTSRSQILILTYCCGTLSPSAGFSSSKRHRTACCIAPFISTCAERIVRVDRPRFVICWYTA